MILNKALVFLIGVFISNLLTATPTEIIIPRSMLGDKGKYFLLEKKKLGNIYQVLHKRVGVDTIGYSLTEINCVTMQIRELGYSETSAKDIQRKPTKWFDLISGSSKSDLVKFVCK